MLDLVVCTTIFFLPAEIILLVCAGYEMNLQ
jgi:hypothetical protein